MAEKVQFYYLSHDDSTGRLMGCTGFCSWDAIHCIHKAKKKVDEWNGISKRLSLRVSYSLSPTPTIDTSTIGVK